MLNVKALVDAFNQEKALLGAFSVIVKTSPMVRLQLYLGDLDTVDQERGHCDQEEDGSLHVTMSSAARAPLHTGDNSHSFHVPGTHTQHHTASVCSATTLPELQPHCGGSVRCRGQRRQVGQGEVLPVMSHYTAGDAGYWDLS